MSRPVRCGHGWPSNGSTMAHLHSRRMARSWRRRATTPPYCSGISPRFAVERSNTTSSESRRSPLGKRHPLALLLVHLLREGLDRSQDECGTSPRRGGDHRSALVCGDDEPAALGVSPVRNRRPSATPASDRGVRPLNAVHDGGTACGLGDGGQSSGGRQVAWAMRRPSALKWRRPRGRAPRRARHQGHTADHEDRRPFSREARPTRRGPPPHRLPAVPTNGPGGAPPGDPPEGRAITRARRASTQTGHGRDSGRRSSWRANLPD
jgi:hypothetical protein